MNTRKLEFGQLELVRGDIVDQDVDGIVNAANTQLAGGGGVDGAIHRAAGPGLLEACRQLPADASGRRCPTGDVRTTKAGGRLAAQHVIHAVGPVFSSLEKDSATLAGAYRSSLELAAEYEVRRIAFPCISTGVYGFPLEPACDIAVNTAVDWLQKYETPQVVIFCTFSPQDYEFYERRLGELR